VIGLNHGGLIGVAAGLLSFIPYLGSLSGLIVSIRAAIAQSWPDLTLALLVLAIFFVGQSVADYILAPYLVGRRVHLNPLWMMFAMFAFGYLFGFVGPPPSACRCALRCVSVTQAHYGPPPLRCARSAEREFRATNLARGR
jgi:hypothetical protein